MTLTQNTPYYLKLFLVVTFPLMLLVCVCWLAGYFYLQIAHLENIQATPLTLYHYWVYYGDIEHTKTWIIFCLILSFSVIFCPIIMICLPKKRKLYGNAQFATYSDIRKANLYASSGIIVGKITSFFGLFEKYLIFSGSQHVLISAPTRSGKGVGIVIPNLLLWQESVVVLDIKQENWQITAGFRAKHGQTCFLLNLAPRDYHSHRWNPLFYISDDIHFRINDIQKIGTMLFPNLEGEAPIWQASSRSLWLGIVLYLLETESLPVTLGEVLRQVTMGDDYLRDVLTQRLASDNPLSSECSLALHDYLQTPEKTRGSIKKSFLSALELFYNPVIDAVTSGNDFDLRNIRKKKMSIYVGVSPDDLNRLSPLINLFFQQLIDLNTRELPENNHTLKHQVLILADEFTAMGKVTILSKAISYIAGYGLRMLPIIQSPAQLREVYGHDATENFMENHALHIVFAPKNIKTAEEISKTIGTQTIKTTSRTKQLLGKASLSESRSDYGRSLLLPQEVKTIGQDKALIFLENCPPIVCDKIKWFKDSFFKSKGNSRETTQYQPPTVPKINPTIRTMPAFIRPKPFEADTSRITHYNFEEYE
jgi:type IV secretion system protein VirD4